MKEKLPKIDVLKSSPIQEAVKLTKLNREEVDKLGYSNIELLRKDEESGDFYRKKVLNDEKAPRQNIEIERFVSLLTKGILHVSDIIEKDNEYYSRYNYLNLENSEKEKRGEIEAELLILKYLFGDWDKDSVVSNTNTTDNNISTKDNNFAHFDYGEAFRRSHNNEFYFSEKEYPGYFRKRLSEILDDPILINYFGEYYKELIKGGELTDYKKTSQSEMIEDELLTKIEQINEAIKLPGENNQKDFFVAVINKAKLDLGNERFSFLAEDTKEGRIEELRNILISRLEVLKSVILDRKNKRKKLA